MTSNDDILREIMKALGGVEAKLDAVVDRLDRSDEVFISEQKSAHDSRAVIHTRLDAQTEKIGRLETTVAVSGKVEAMLRDGINDLKVTVQSNHNAVQPALEEWKRMRTIGIGISGLIAFAGLTIGGIITYVGDGAVSALRHWLKIN